MRTKTASGGRVVVSKGGGAPRKGGHVVSHKALASRGIVATKAAPSAPRSRKGNPRKNRPGGPIVKKTRALDEIRTQQLSTEVLLAYAPFERLVRRIVRDTFPEKDYRFQRDTLEALRAAAEARLVEMFTVAYVLTIHCGRITLMSKDIRTLHMINRLQGNCEFPEQMCLAGRPLEYPAREATPRVEDVTDQDAEVLEVEDDQQGDEE